MSTRSTSHSKKSEVVGSSKEEAKISRAQRCVLNRIKKAAAASLSNDTSCKVYSNSVLRAATAAAALENHFVAVWLKVTGFH